MPRQHQLPAPRLHRPHFTVHFVVPITVHAHVHIPRDTSLGPHLRHVDLPVVGHPLLRGLQHLRPADVSIGAVGLCHRLCAFRDRMVGLRDGEDGPGARVDGGGVEYEFAVDVFAVGLVCAMRSGRSSRQSVRVECRRMSWVAARRLEHRS